MIRFHKKCNECSATVHIETDMKKELKCPYCKAKLLKKGEKINENMGDK